jgi:hypothetical protein
MCDFSDKKKDEEIDGIQTVIHRSGVFLALTDFPLPQELR